VILAKSCSFVETEQKAPVKIVTIRIQFQVTDVVQYAKLRKGINVRTLLLNVRQFVGMERRKELKNVMIRMKLIETDAIRRAKLKMDTRV